MRLATDGNQAYRLDWIRKVMDRTDEQTKSGAIDFALEFTIHHLNALERAKDHPDMTPELAERLSTHKAQLTVERHATLDVNE